MLQSEAVNCNRCGKAVCEQCSTSKRRLSKLEKKKYRVCDYCDTVLVNFSLDQMWAREVGNKQNRREDMKDAIRDISKDVKDTIRDN